LQILWKIHVVPSLARIYVNEIINYCVQYIVIWYNSAIGLKYRTSVIYLMHSLKFLV